MILFFVPETMQRTLEELDWVFAVARLALESSIARVARRDGGWIGDAWTPCYG